MRNFHKNEKVVFLSFSVYSSSPLDPNTLGRDNVVQIDVQDVHLNVGAGERGGTGGCGGRGGACASCLTLPLKQNKKKTVPRKQFGRREAAETHEEAGGGDTCVAQEVDVPKSHEDVHEHARPTLDPKRQTDALTLNRAPPRKLEPPRVLS